MPRRKAEQGQVYHTDLTKQKIAEKQRYNLLNKRSNLLQTSQCEYCGFVGQTNMVIRWHNDNCLKNPNNTKKRDSRDQLIRLMSQKAHGVNQQKYEQKKHEEYEQSRWSYISPKLKGKWIQPD